MLVFYSTSAPKQDNECSTLTLPTSVNAIVWVEDDCMEVVLLHPPKKWVVPLKGTDVIVEAVLCMFVDLQLASGGQSNLIENGHP